MSHIQLIDLSPYNPRPSIEEDEPSSADNGGGGRGCCGEQEDGVVSHPADDTDSSKRTTMEIQCLSELTPLDMMDLSFGINDATGNCIWTGAFFFVEIFARDLDLSGTSQNSLEQSSEQAREMFLALSSSSTAEDLKPIKAIEMRKYLSNLRRLLFPTGCQVLELGAGTGMSGLSLVTMEQEKKKQCDADQQQRNKFDGTIRPSIIVLTDSNNDSLDLCHKNREANISDEDLHDKIHIQRLEWGEGNAAQLFPMLQMNATTLPSKYDTVFATDVLYDLSSLQPLVITASELLKEGGYFILSHVPRASVPKSMIADQSDKPLDENNLIEDDDSYHAVGTSQQIEPVIIREASKVNLKLVPIPSFTYSGGSSDDSKKCNTVVNQVHNDKIGMILRPTILSHLWEESPIKSRMMPSSAMNKSSWQKMIDVGAAILTFRKLQE